jgi:hypothetical protein
MPNSPRLNRPTFGERSACARCGTDIEYHGKPHGWIDRGGNRACVAYHDNRGELVRPSANAKHKPV